MTAIAFRIEGAFVAKLARERAWYDENRAGALSLLGCLSHEGDPIIGLSGDAMNMILDGDATLTGDSSAGVHFLQKEDKAWKAVVERRKDFFARRAAAKAQELLDRQAEVVRAQSLDAIRAEVTRDLREAGLGEFMSREPFTGRKKLKGKAVKVGRWRVPRPLLEQYITVVDRIRRGAFLGVKSESEIANDPLAFFKLEERRVEIHDEIMKVLGLQRDTEDGDDFTRELHAKYGVFTEEE